MSIKQRISNLQEFFDLNPKGKMNGIQVLEHYRALHPCVDQPLNISFVAMYNDIYFIATNRRTMNVRFSFAS